jgi:hypothetical protein
VEEMILTLDLRFRQGTQADCTQRRLLALESWACGLSWSSLLEEVAVGPRAIVDHRGNEGTVRAGSEDVLVMPSSGPGRRVIRV